ncbi:MAG: hypothetical protein IPO18_20005 [bacterium]|nr:hypothetical protein [bacterium]
MNTTRRFIAGLTGFALLVCGSGAQAGTPSAANSRVFYGSGDLGALSMSLYVLPDGSGPALTGAKVRALAGTAVDATITVVLKDSDDEWVDPYPAADIWLESLSGPLAFCASAPAIADEPASYHRLPPLNPSDPQPPQLEWSTTFSGPFHGGGHSDPAAGDRVVVMTASTGATPLPSPPADLQMNSADINGDLIIDLNDVPLFTSDYYLGVYVFRSDFHADGFVNLSDIGVFATTYNRSCP